ncbi:MAG: Lipid-A-disaccharide synthase [Fibrobacteres bacterium]|nr:Lipid-A-disaccharide synthase [Fibrobacterota bacterium]
MSLEAEPAGLGLPAEPAGLGLPAGPARPPRVFVSAGEVSGDGILGSILARLRASLPDLELRGLGGASAAAWGLEPLFPMERTAFSGAWDVIRNAGFALGMYAKAAREMRRFRPDLAVLVDYPGLNLRLARLARNLGVPVCFVAPPQAWAYRDPARKLRRAGSALEGCALHVLFPFEAAAYAPIASRLSVGHFLAAPAAAPQDGPPREPLLCLCPGSRLPVLRRNLPVWLGLLEREGLDDREGIAVLVPPHLADAARRILAGLDLKAGAASVKWSTRAEVRTDKAATLAAAVRALAFPGTVTLELALRRIPTLVLAILDPLTLALGRRVLAARRLALPNLLLEEELFPEWAGAFPGPDAATFGELIRKRDALNGWEDRLERLARRMGTGDGPEEASRACLDLLRRIPVTAKAAIG